MKIKFQVENENLCFYMEKFSNFINSDGCIGKVASKSIRLYPAFIKKISEFNKKKDYFLCKNEKFR